MAHLLGSRLWLALLCVLLAGLAVSCASASAPALPSAVVPTRYLPSPTSRITASPPAAASPTARPSPTALPPTNTQLPFQVCSPLQGFELADLPAAIANPYHPPPLGSDDPHQGLDLAQLKDGIAISGLPVQAVMEGRAALAVSGRFPYGNALLVETPLEALPSSWQDQLDLPSIPATPQARSALTCPTPPAPLGGDPKARSLYLLYAHLLDPPALKPGDPVACGQVIGAIGGSGNALNPHLHLEVRLGPAGVRFPGMAHYHASASPEEMSAYCQWRVSGSFVHLDPLLLFPVSQP